VAKLDECKGFLSADQAGMLARQFSIGGLKNIGVYSVLSKHRRIGSQSK